MRALARSLGWWRCALMAARARWKSSSCARALAEAGLVRLVSALESPGDPLRARLRPLLDGERPLYRLDAAVVLANATRVRQTALAAQNTPTKRVLITQ